MTRPNLARLTLETWRTGPKTSFRLAELAKHYAEQYHESADDVYQAAIALTWTGEIVSDSQTFVVGDLGVLHVIGSPSCPECWSGYPRPHDGCSGFIHAAFGDEDADCNYWLYTKCDVCGDPE